MNSYKSGLTLDGLRCALNGRGAVAVCCMVAVIFFSAPAHAIQTVSLSFHTVSLTDPLDEYVYSPAEQTVIKEILEIIYLSDPGDPGGGPLGMKFEIFDPLFPPAPFTTSIIKFNNGFIGGAAEKLDFRNLDGADDVDINAFGLLRAFEGSAKAGGGTWTLPELTTPEAVVFASANLAAHELGHAMGLRHHDSFGPINSGIGVAGDKYDPVYIGPTFATNSSFHVMGLASTVALNADTLTTPSWLSERSAMKLVFNEAGPLATEVVTMNDSPPEAQPVPLAGVFVPNTQLEPPDPYFPDPVDLTPVTAFAGFTGGIIGGSLDDPFDVDYYSFSADAGSIVTIEAVSSIIAATDPTRMPDPVDMVIEILDSSLTPVPYPAATPFSANDDQFESTDSMLIDVEIPTTGTYYIDLRGSDKPGADKTGSYELYIMGFLPMPKPFLAGDLDGDCFVGILDLNIVLANWNDTVTAGDLALGDPNGDAFVGIEDLNIVLGNWNAGDPPSHNAIIPEPTTLALLGLGGAAITRRRR